METINKEKDMDLYCCYSLNLREFLYNNGLRYKLAALNPNSKSLFWVYIKTDKLDKLLSSTATMVPRTSRIIILLRSCSPFNK